MPRLKSGATKVKPSMLARAARPWGALFLLPTAAAFTACFIWPFAWGVYLSFFDFKTVSLREFVGLDNYIAALSDGELLNSFAFTAAYTLITVLAVNIAAFLIALALTAGIRGTGIFRTVFFMPNLIGGIVLGYIWQLIINGIALKINAEDPPLISLNASTGFWGLVVLMCWQQIGYMMIIYIAALQSIPKEYTEAAKIDGAGPLQVLRHITLPSVMPSITICGFLTLTGSFKLFDQNLALTGGEPYGKTEMLALNIYKTFYESAVSKGVGQAKAVLFFIAVAVIALLQLKFTAKGEAEK